MLPQSAYVIGSRCKPAYESFIELGQRRETLVNTTRPAQLLYGWQSGSRQNKVKRGSFTNGRVHTDFTTHFLYHSLHDR
jgi:hypothetical protein